MSCLNFINNNLRIAANFQFYLFACGRKTDLGCGNEVGYCENDEFGMKGMYFLEFKVKKSVYPVIVFINFSCLILFCCLFTFFFL